MSDNKEIQINNDFNIADLIKTAIEKGNLDTVERIMVLRDKLKAEKAKEEYDKALRSFQEECPVIERIKEGNKTKGGEIAFLYAPLEYIVEKTRPILTKHGFSWSWKPEFLEGAVKVSCIVNHIGGHSETSIVMMPLGTATQLMGVQQIVGSAISYAERYSFTGAFGIVTRGEDNEKNLEGNKTMTGNETIFQARWNDYENIINAVKDIMTDSEKASDKKVRARKNTIQDINKAIEYYLKKYSIEITKFNEGIKSNITMEDVK